VREEVDFLKQSLRKVMEEEEGEFLGQTLRNLEEEEGDFLAHMSRKWRRRRRRVTS
jgi:hypothetical protein